MRWPMKQPGSRSTRKQAPQPSRGPFSRRPTGPTKIEPSAEFRKTARIASFEEYQRLYRESLDEPGSTIVWAALPL